MFLTNRRISALLLAVVAVFSVCTVSALATEATGAAEGTAPFGLKPWLFAVIIAAVVIAAAVIAFFAFKSKKKEAAADGAQKNRKKTVGEKLKKFWRDYKSELKKITWSPWRAVKKNTLIVLAMLVALAIVIGVLDYLFSNGITLLGRIAG